MKKIRKKSGNPIRGKMRPFLTEDYTKALKTVLGWAETYNDFYQYRTVCKHFVADRFRIAAQQHNQYSSLPTQEMINHLTTCGYNRNMIHFVHCILDCYNDINLCLHFVDKTACRKSTELCTTCQYAARDIELLLYRDIARVYKKLSNSSTMSTADHARIMAQYKLLSDSVILIVKLFRTLYRSSLPKGLSIDHYNKILMLDSTLKHYYHFDGVKYVINSTSGKPIYKRLNNDAAALLALVVIA